MTSTVLYVMADVRLVFTIQHVIRHVLLTVMDHVATPQEIVWPVNLVFMAASVSTTVLTVKMVHVHSLVESVMVVVKTVGTLFNVMYLVIQTVITNVISTLVTVLGVIQGYMVINVNTVVLHNA